MNLKIDLGYLNSVFVVPRAVVDDHIKLAGAVQLKVLLYVLRYAGENLTLQDIANALTMSCADVKDAMQYWIETRLISKLPDECCSSQKIGRPKDEGTHPLATAINEAESDLTQNKKRQVIENRAPHLESNFAKNKPLQKFEATSNVPTLAEPSANNLAMRHKVVSTRPDNKSIAERIDGSAEIKFLMQEAQVILARPISNADSATLLMLHDVDGLPVDVILMLLQYSVSVGKCNMRYIEKVAMAWGNEEINTIEKAEAKIKTLEKNRTAWLKVQKILGIEGRAPTTKELEAFSRWVNDWNFSESLIKEAYDRCVDLKGKYILNYIDSIIKRWKMQGIISLEQAQNEKNMKKTRTQTNTSPSYNIESYFETMDTFA